MGWFGTRQEPDPAIMAALGRVRIFENLAPRDIADLALRIEVKEFAPGDVICREGEAGDGMYVVADGCVDVYLAPKSGPRKDLASFGGGEFFGEMALIKEENLRTATVAASTDCRCLFLSKENFVKLLNSSHATAAKILYKLCRVLADRLSRTSMLAAGIVAETAPAFCRAESAPALTRPPLPPAPGQ